MYTLPGSLVGKESACNAGDMGSIPELGRSPGEGNGNPLQYSCPGKEISWAEEPHGLQAMVSQELDMSSRLNHINTHIWLHTHRKIWKTKPFALVGSRKAIGNFHSVCVVLYRLLHFHAYTSFS